jgi:hypothetical protein
MNMPLKTVVLIIVILVIASAFFVYQNYNRASEEALRSERVSLLMSLNLTDYETATLFDDKYNYLAGDGNYNQTVLEFFRYWCLNQSLAEEYLVTFKNLEEANGHLSEYYTEYYAKPKRISCLIEHANATELEATMFDNEFKYLATGNEYNQTVLEFFRYWCANSSLASLSLSIIQDVKKTNNYLSKLEKAAVNFFSGDNLTVILSMSMDKEEYVIGGDKYFNLTIIILSSKNLDNVAVDVFGFKSPTKGYVVKNIWIFGTRVKQILVNKGLNLESFNADIPCSPCYGISSGLNNLTFIIKYDHLTLSVTKTFMLKSRS